MRKWVPLVAALAVIVAGAVLYLVLANRSDGGTPSTCKEALRAQYRAALESGTEGHRPGECAGLSDAELERLAGEVLSEESTR